MGTNLPAFHWEAQHRQTLEVSCQRQGKSNPKGKGGEMLILIVVMAVVLVVSGPPKVYPGDYPRTLRAFTLNILMVAGAGSLLFLNIGLRERSQAFFYADFRSAKLHSYIVSHVYSHSVRLRVFA